MRHLYWSHSLFLKCIFVLKWFEEEKSGVWGLEAKRLTGREKEWHHRRKTSSEIKSRGTDRGFCGNLWRFWAQTLNFERNLLDLRSRWLALAKQVRLIWRRGLYWFLVFIFAFWNFWIFFFPLFSKWWVNEF